MSSPKDRNRPARSRDRPSPSSRPRVAPTTAIMKASIITERVTCFLLAPRARSSADSRTRWDTRIEKVLKMMNAPTTIAITAKVVRKIEMTSRNWPIWSWVSLTTLSPVTAVKPSGATAAAAAASSFCETPSAPVRETLVKASSPPRKISCASAVSSRTRVAPAVPPPLKSAVPTRVNVRRGSLLSVGDDHRDGVADLVAAALRRGRVERDLAGLLGPAARRRAARICSPAMFSPGA